MRWILCLFTILHFSMILACTPDEEILDNKPETPHPEIEDENQVVFTRQDRLLELVYQSSSDEVLEIVDDEPGFLETRDEADRSILWLAALEKNWILVTELINRGADMDYSPKDNYTLLHWAAEFGELELARILLELGASVSIPYKMNPSQIRIDGYTVSNFRPTPLQLAIYVNQLEWVKTIAQEFPVILLEELSAGFTVSVRREKAPRLSFAPENSAISSAQVAIMLNKESLLDVLITPSLLDRQLPLLITAVFFQRWNLVEKFIEAEYYWMNENFSQGIYGDSDTVLSLLIKEDRFDLLRKLVQAGYDINHHNNYGRTVLHVSMDQKDFDQIDELLELGADPNLLFCPEDLEGEPSENCAKSALHYALLEHSNIELADQFLASGADLNIRSDTVFTPLYYACMEKNEAVVRYLIKRGAKDFDLLDEHRDFLNSLGLSF
jgi:ankyrin repeat protein